MESFFLVLCGYHMIFKLKEMVYIKNETDYVLHAIQDIVEPMFVVIGLPSEWNFNLNV